MSESHERKIKRILGRDWDELRDLWLDHVPFIEFPGKPPELFLSDLSELGSSLAKISRDQVEEVAGDIPGLRAGLLHEGVFLTHKAVHVLGSALIHVSNGMCTWSLSSAYHSAFFAMKAVLSLLGVNVIESNNGHFVVDVWGKPHKPRKGIKPPIILLANTGRTEPRHLWAYLQRTVEQTLNYETIFNEDFRSVLIQSGYTDFARQRNGIHYRTNVWSLDDLHKCVTQQGFGEKGPNPIDSSQPDFSLLLAFGLVRSSHQMLQQLAQTSNVLAAEVKLIDTWLAEPFNKLYQQNVA